MMQLYQLLDLIQLEHIRLIFTMQAMDSTGSLTINGDGSDVSQGATISINILADALMNGMKK